MNHVVFTHGSGVDLNVRNRPNLTNSTVVGTRRYGSLVNVRSTSLEHVSVGSANNWGELALNQFANITRGDTHTTGANGDLNLVRVTDIPGNRRMFTTANVRLRVGPLNNAFTPYITELNSGTAVTATHTVTIPELRGHSRNFSAFIRNWTRVAVGQNEGWIASEFLRNA